MAGIDNLKAPATSEEAREKGRKGGLASVEARRRKKSMQEWARVLLESSGGLTDAEKAQLAELGMDATQGNAILAAMATKARRSERAAEFVRDTSGQKPETQAHITLGEGLSPAEIRGLTDEELQSILDGE